MVTLSSEEEAWTEGKAWTSGCWKELRLWNRVIAQMSDVDKAQSRGRKNKEQVAK
jgi:hypothetical protein